MEYKKCTTMLVSKELKQELNKIGIKGDTYEKIVWRLIIANNSCSCGLEVSD